MLFASLSVSILMTIIIFSMCTWVIRYQNVSVLDFVGAENDGGGGDNWTYDVHCSSQIVTATNQR